jgi:hypothetical protein
LRGIQDLSTWENSSSLPASVEIFGASCFADCIKLTDFVFEVPWELHVIESQAFASTPIRELIIPASVETMPHALLKVLKVEIRLERLVFESGSRLKKDGC